MNIELVALEANDTQKIVSLPPNKNTIGCKWLYKVKYKDNGKGYRFKARLVFKGFTQIVGLDYFDMFALVAKMATLRIILTLAAKFNQSIGQLDVTNAFFHNQLHEEVYMDISPRFVKPGHIMQCYLNQKLICKLVKSLYGLKKAHRE